MLQLNFQGSYAIVEFRSRDSVAKLLQPGNPLYLGKRKLTIKPREVKTYVPKKKPEGTEVAESTEAASFDLTCVLAELTSRNNVGNR